MILVCFIVFSILDAASFFEPAVLRPFMLPIIRAESHQMILLEANSVTACVLDMREAIENNINEANYTSVHSAMMSNLHGHLNVISKLNAKYKI
jgi:hypothetical protein